jgi:hypothetical protein
MPFALRISAPRRAAYETIRERKGAAVLLTAPVNCTRIFYETGILPELRSFVLCGVTVNGLMI